MTQQGLDVPFTDGVDNQEREYYYKRLIRHFPELDGHPSVLYGDNKLTYFRLLNEGLIAEVPEYDPQSLDDFVNTSVGNSNYAERVRLLEKRDEMGPGQKNDAEIAHAVGIVGGQANSAINSQIDRAGIRVFATGNTIADRANIESKMSTAAALGVPLIAVGDFRFDTIIQVPTGLNADFSGSTLTQTKPLTPLFITTGTTDIRLSGITAYGIPSDYKNTSGVYLSAGITLQTGSRRIVITDCHLKGFAGAGIRSLPDVEDVTVADCIIEGPGPQYITTTEFNYSCGISIPTNSKNWKIRGNDISGYSQGVVTGNDLMNIRITDNYIHDIPGQHGLYLESLNGGIIADNLFRNIGLAGMKIQIGVGGVPIDTDGVTITGNTFINCGAQAILLTNVIDSITRTRSVSVTGNVARDCNALVEVYDSRDVTIVGNQGYGLVYGIRAIRVQKFIISENLLSELSQTGIWIGASNGVIISGNWITDPASLQDTSTNFGISIGTNSSEITLRDNKVTDSRGFMRYGIYHGAPTETSDIVDNYVSGAIQYGYRGSSSGPTTIRAFRGNVFNGTLGAMLTAPTNFTAINSPTADVNSLKTAVDALRNVLINNNLTP